MTKRRQTAFQLYLSMLEPQPNVSILRITVCTISDNEGINKDDDDDDDNDGIPISSDVCVAVLDFIVCCLLLAHVTSDNRQPNVIFC